MYGAGAAWSRLILPGAGADPSRSEPESAPGPWPSEARAAQKSGGSATLPKRQKPPFSKKKNTSWGPTTFDFYFSKYIFALIRASVHKDPRKDVITLKKIRSKGVNSALIRFVFSLAFQRRILNFSTAKTCIDTTKRWWWWWWRGRGVLQFWRQI